MDYYTQFNLEVTDEKGNFISQEEEAKIIQMLGDIGDSNYDTLEDYFNEGIKWYDWAEDMHDIAIKFPNYVFTLKGIGEDNEDWWIAKFHGDLYFQKLVVLPEINEDELQPFPKKTSGYNANDNTSKFYSDIGLTNPYEVLNDIKDGKIEMAGKDWNSISVNGVKVELPMKYENFKQKTKTFIFSDDESWQKCEVDISELPVLNNTSKDIGFELGVRCKTAYIDMINFTIFLIGLTYDNGCWYVTSIWSYPLIWSSTNSPIPIICSHDVYKGQVITEKELLTVFSDCENVESQYLGYNPQTKKHKKAFCFTSQKDKDGKVMQISIQLEIDNYTDYSRIVNIRQSYR